MTVGRMHVILAGIAVLYPALYSYIIGQLTATISSVQREAQAQTATAHRHALSLHQGVAHSTSSCAPLLVPTAPAG